MAVDREQREVTRLVDATSDMRWNAHKFGRLLAEQPDFILLNTASSFLAFFEMLAIRYEVGDFDNAEMAKLLRISKSVRDTYYQEFQN